MGNVITPRINHPWWVKCRRRPMVLLNICFVLLVPLYVFLSLANIFMELSLARCLPEVIKPLLADFGLFGHLGHVSFFTTLDGGSISGKNYKVWRYYTGSVEEVLHGDFECEVCVRPSPWQSPESYSTFLANGAYRTVMLTGNGCLRTRVALLSSAGLIAMIFCNVFPNLLVINRRLLIWLLLPQEREPDEKYLLMEAECFVYMQRILVFYEHY